jgi:hypothetical protein
MTGGGGFTLGGRERIQTPKERAYERFCTKPTGCEDFPDLQICSQLRICEFVDRWRQKKNRKFANAQLAIVEIWDTLLYPQKSCRGRGRNREALRKLESYCALCTLACSDSLFSEI